MLLEGKTAIITGAASKRGIGLATAKAFIAHGARVAITDVDAENLPKAHAAIGDDQRAFVCDVTDAARCREVAAQVAADFGGIDILVNNAGIVFGTPILEITAGEYDTVLGINLRGNFNMAQAVIPFMREKGAGAIVCVSSIAGQSGGGVFGRSHYAAAKAGIMGLAKALGRELAPENIRVNAVAAGSVDNDFTRGRMTPEIKAAVAKNVPMGRLGTPEDMANACLFLASDLAGYVTGTVLDVNGGLLIH